jgi:hypothetical protein
LLVDNYLDISLTDTLALNISEVQLYRGEGMGELDWRGV